MKLTSIFLLFCFYTLFVNAQTVVPNTTTTSQATAIPQPIPIYTTAPLLNYIRTWTAQKPTTQSTDITSTSAVSDFVQETQYVDGLGRPLQTVSKAITPLGKDLVAPIIYDEFGREVYKYLPYVSNSSDGNFKTDPFTEQATFMQSQYGSQGEIFFYGKTEFESSPLNRVSRTWVPGNSWIGSSAQSNPSLNRYVGMSYEINEANEVLLWNVDISSNVAPITDPSKLYYGAGQLYRTVTRDEHETRVVEYKDKEGQVVLKKVELTKNASITSHDGWLCTYYVYDDLKHLRYVIQPKAVEEMRVAGNWVLNSEQLKELCFHYEYDARERMILKHVPGAGNANDPGDVYLVYDARDRLVYTQDGNMRVKHWWMVTLYDELNRPTTTGIMVYGGTLSELQSYTADPSHLNGYSTFYVRGSNLQPNLVATRRDPSITDYKASVDVVFTGEFSSTGGDEFIAEISSETPTSMPKEVPGNLLLLPTDFYPLTLTYYDNYSSTQKTYDNTNLLKLLTDLPPNTNYENPPTSKSNLTKGAVTGSKVWVLEDANDLTKGRWIETVSFYDDKGRVIQTRSDNINDGKESITSLYDFSGKVLCTYQAHENPFSTLGEVRIKTNMDYDAAGRLLAIRKQINDDPWSNTTVAKNEYDELGQLKNKYQGYNDNAADDFNGENYWNKLAYEYNIRGWLRGINKDYANNISNQTTGFSFFGEELNYDYGFSRQQFNGNIAGIKWKGFGDGEQRAYGFDYDNANRLTKADFTQLSGNAWNTSAGFDFSVSGKSGKIEYDENGNIKSMLQMGWKPGGSVILDNMVYSYLPSSNRLNSVTDLNNDGSSKLGDFKTIGTHPQYSTKSTLTVSSSQAQFDAINDYNYDVNGNLTQDKNKGINSITYNHLNLPYRIDIPGKGYITYIYDALGNKLQKKVHDETNTKKPDAATTYMGVFEYQDNEIEFIAQEEGRFRYKPAQTLDMGDGYTYTYPAYYVTDYFIKDHLGNVRTVFTNERTADNYPAATMEDGNATIEEQLYSNLNTTRDVLPNGYPAGDGTNQKVAKVGGGNPKIGPSILLKVMAGDQMNISVDSWYKTWGATPNAPEPITNLATILADNVQQITGGKITSNQLTSSTSFTTEIAQFLSDQEGNSDPSKPKAFLNWILFDDHFNMVQDSYGFDEVPDETAFTGANGPQVYKHVVPYLSVPKNGYLYVYVSNETPNISVFFDNLQLQHLRGPLMEETHYYPFGLTMSGISSKAVAFGEPENKKEFNGIEHTTDLDLNQYDAFYRTLDPQIGRFWQTDPKPTDFESLYAAMGNNPISNMDFLGDSLYNQADITIANGIEKDINSANANLGKQANKLNSQIATAEAKGDMKKAAKLRAKLGDVNSQISENTTSLTRLNAIRNDQTMAYTFNVLPAGSIKGGTDLELVNDPAGGKQLAVVMNVVPDAFGNVSSSNAVHEVTHAYQGRISHLINLVQNGANFPGRTLFEQLMTNAVSEIEAYRAQYGLDPSSMPSSTKGGVPTSMSAINIPYVGGINDNSRPPQPVYPNVQRLANMLEAVNKLLRIF